MGLFDNINLLDLFLPTAGNQSNQHLAEKSGLDLGDFAKIAAVGLPAILNAIKRNNHRNGGIESFNQALTKHQEEVTHYQAPEQLVQNVDAEDGAKIVNHVFDDQQSVFERIGNALNLSPDAVKRALVVIAPIVLKYIADQKTAKSNDPEKLAGETSSLVDHLNQSIQAFSQQKSTTPAPNDWFTNIQNNRYEPKGNGGVLDAVFELFK